MELNLQDKNTWWFLIFFFLIVFLLQANDMNSSITRFIFLKVLPAKNVHAVVQKETTVETVQGPSTTYRLAYVVNNKAYVIDEVVNNISVTPVNNSIWIRHSLTKPAIAAIPNNSINESFVYSCAFIVVSIYIFRRGLKVLLKKQHTTPASMQ